MNITRTCPVPSRNCSKGMMTSASRQFGLLMAFGRTPILLLPHRPLDLLALLPSLPSPTPPHHLLRYLLSLQQQVKAIRSHRLLTHARPTFMVKGTHSRLPLTLARPTIMLFQLQFHTIPSQFLIKHFPTSFPHPPTPPSPMTPPRSCRQMHLYQPIRWNQHPY